MENILLGVFCSAFVVLITYIGAYNIEKGKTIGLLLYYCGEYTLEMPNLILLLEDISEDGICSYDINAAKVRIKSDRNVHEEVTKLMSIYDKRLLEVDGFFPIIKRIKNRNLEVHNLILLFARLHCAIQYFDMTYKVHNSTIYRIELQNDYSEEQLQAAIRTILQIESSDYKDFLDAYKVVHDKHRPSTIFEHEGEIKCP